MTASGIAKVPDRKWLRRLTWAGAVVSVLFLLGFAYWLFFDGGWGSLRGKQANEVGDLLAGLFAPLAFLWLVLGYLQQGRELVNQIAESNRLATAAEQQLELVLSNEKHTKRDLFSRILEQVNNELDSIAARILMACKEGKITEHRNAAEKARLAGYKDAYFTGLIEAYRDYPEDLLGRSDNESTRVVAWALLMKQKGCFNEVWRYLVLMESIILEAKNADPGGSLERQLLRGRSHDLYLLLKGFDAHKDDIDDAFGSFVST